MTCDTVDTDTLRIDDMHVVRPPGGRPGYPQDAHHCH